MAVDEAAAGPPPALDEALDGVATALRSDGYALEWAADQERRVCFVVTADDDACAECLVPEPVLVAMFGEALHGTGFTVGTVTTPAGL